MFCRYSAVDSAAIERLRELGPWAEVCVNPGARRIRDLMLKEEFRRTLPDQDENSNLVDFTNEPFGDQVHGMDDLSLYVYSDLYFIVHKVWGNGRWWQSIRSVRLDEFTKDYWLSDDIAEAIDLSKRIGLCPNCCPEGLPWPQARVIVPIRPLAEYYLALGWDSKIVREVILHEVD